MEKELISLYHFFEIDENATIEDIKRAYKSKAKLYHPDLFIEKKDKLEAEKKFKELKEAYDYLILLKIKNNQEHEQEEIKTENYYDFSEFYQNDFVDDYDEFINNKSKSFETLQKKAIDFIEQEMKRRRISKLQAFNCIYHNKNILNWSLGEYDSVTLNDFIVKESLYRRYIRETDEYKGFSNNHSKYNKLNVNAVLYINKQKYSKKKFDEKIRYTINSICPSCKGIGCSLCNLKGWMKKDIIAPIKVDLNSERTYIFKEYGNQSPIVNGKLILSVKFVNNTNYQYKFMIKDKSLTRRIGFDRILDNTINIIKNSYNWIINHKHLSLLYLIIIALLITIICLSILL